ncbi:MAG: aminotransferase class III-fold pyridoxal phosphate-dependent enzyme [Acidobacteria bacterium]|nr:aminotransferase class III-fold pyridoxal phosphate-dependent enzyme [Acidobacteriota bacterium]
MPTDLGLLEDAYQLRTYKKLPLQVVRGEGVWVYTSDGQRYLDLYGGHAVVSTGHCHPRVVDAIQRQAAQMIFYSNIVYSEVRGRAAAALARAAPPELRKIFFVNSGSEANENAIKLARKVTGKLRVISFEGGFHGRTIGSLSATGIKKYRDQYSPLVPGHEFVPFGDLEALRRCVALTGPEGSDTAAILLEPIQSMAGVRTAGADFFRGIRKLCDEIGAMLIYDEIQTGFGRTGTFFFAGRHEVMPDMVTLAKGMASGLPMGAVLVTDKIAEQVKFDDLGSTFGGGPLVSAALEATVQVIEEEGLLENVIRQSDYLKTALGGLVSVEEVRGEGFLLGIKFKSEAARYQQALLQAMILTGLSGDPRVLRLLPPLSLGRAEIDRFLDVLARVN